MIRQWLRRQMRLSPEMLSPLGRAALFAWRHKITPIGRMLLLVLLIAGTVSVTIGPNFPLYIFMLFLFSFLLVGRLVNLLFAPRLALTRRLPERCAADAVVAVAATATNRSWLPVYDLMASEQQPHWSIEVNTSAALPELPAGASANLSYTLKPRRRGAYDLAGPIALSSFPFGVYNHSQRVKALQRILVYPRFVPLLDIDLPVGRKYQPGGLRLVSSVGDSEEFLGNREYRPGDRLRDIHHAAWARLGMPVVREFQEEYLCRIALIVDTYCPDDQPNSLEDFEAGLSLCAAIADVLSRREYVVDLFAAGLELYHFQAGRGLAYLDNILDILACLDTCRRSPFAALGASLTEAVREISTAIFVMLDWTVERERFIQGMREAGVAAKVLVVRSSQLTCDPAAWSADGEPIKIFTAPEVSSGIERI